jgi:hypothetical protein
MSAVQVALVRLTVIAARRAGVFCDDLAQDSLVASDVIEDWVRLDDVCPNP